MAVVSLSSSSIPSAYTTKSSANTPIFSLSIISRRRSIIVPKNIIKRRGEIELPYGHPLSILCDSLSSTEKLLEYKKMWTIRRVRSEAPICRRRRIRRSWSTRSKADFQSINSMKYRSLLYFFAAKFCLVIHLSSIFSMQTEVFLFSLKPNYSVPVIVFVFAKRVNSQRARFSKYTFMMSAI
jgi:hypothetical protein